jgi:arabinose-5-phosphate isomerase
MSSSETSPDREFLRSVLLAESGAIAHIASVVGDSFVRAVEAMHDCEGKVVLTGIGKAGIIARKISATLASTGTPSIFLHPVEALHGDIGRVASGDVAVVLSHSGATEEILRLLDHLKGLGAVLVALTGTADSPLGRYAEITVDYGRTDEACPLGLAPTVSTTCMLAVGDALALTVMKRRNFSPAEFAAYHPAGSLGRKLLKVEEAMAFRKGEQLGLAEDSLPLGDALAQSQRSGRRAGAMLLVDAEGRLSGILTDADLRRCLLARGDRDLLDTPVRELMIAEPKCVHVGDLASEALAILHGHRIDELPVLDDENRPVGLIDVQDLLGIKTYTEAADG